MKKTLLAISAAGLLAPLASQATDGYFSHGYGLKAKGMGGAATAMAVDSFGGANNPASMVWAGERLDVGLDWFRPTRSMERTGAAAGSNINASATSGSNNFYIPEFGYNKMLNPNLSIGVTVYGNGGMNTDYPGGQITAASGVGTCQFFRAGSIFATAATSFNPLCGDGRLGVDLMQLVVAPTVAMKANKEHSFGISPLIAYQRFKMQGLQGFANYSSDATKLTNNGYDSATGFGARIGWMGKFSENFTLGAAYSTKIRMNKFDKYAGLFAQQGDFDMPTNWNVGIAFKPTTRTTVAVDFQRINYGGIKSVGNPSTNGGATIAGTLGCDNCRGFGWSNIDVWKIGLEYQYSDALTLRAGFNRTDNPIQGRDVTFNILAPGVVKDHYTLGMTYALSKGSDLTVSYVHAASNSVTATSLFDVWLGAGGGGTEKIKMYQNSLGVALGWKY